MLAIATDANMEEFERQIKDDVLVESFSLPFFSLLLVLISKSEISFVIP